MPSTFPETVLRTDSLVLRSFSRADVEDTQRAASDELTQTWLPLPHPYTLDDATAWCSRTAHALRESGDCIHFALADPATDRLLGTIGLRRTSWRARTTEVGYWVAPWARGRGVAAEAARVVGRWALCTQGFERVELRAATGNIASRRSAERAGFQEEGVLRNAGVTHGGRVDLVVFSLTPADLTPAHRLSPGHASRRRDSRLAGVEAGGSAGREVESARCGDGPGRAAGRGTGGR
ncbi:GNAT family N-acetyltransferase [Streptacidiphilus jiangxiensis]|uniref:Protein N-acetyltransferase, RimJ/RimL family n=1 Tax=Streptacidiphilus jiangxiensis TaxID=235985 RepID=A0A1H7HHG1_STRJI|nr:GNAT family N-acetyltransferase [Streptacidiphilus jiangxiensis]SEK49729.1 Protein N-acetyltransferase, RimJ/RimL family [Streptacidiphilus jiangxiensis]